MQGQELSAHIFFFTVVTIKNRRTKVVFPYFWFAVVAIVSYARTRVVCPYFLFYSCCYKKLKDKLSSHIFGLQLL